MTRTILALIALALPALAQNPVPGGSLTSSAPRMAPLLSMQADLADGGAWSFTIPERPSPAHATFEWTVRYEWLPLIGGQNRSGSPHPGFQSGVGDGHVSIWHYFLRDDGTRALPGMGTSRAIGDEWGPTTPATEDDLVPLDVLHEHGDDASVYWGPPPFNPDVPSVFVTNHLLDPDSWIYPVPGERVTFAPEGWWNVPSWDGSHAWPFRVDWNARIIAWGRWVQ